jgi:hypothetical protein
LQVSEAAFVAAALKKSPLFSQKPETLRANVVESAHLMQVSEAAFLAAALKQRKRFDDPLGTWA